MALDPYLKLMVKHQASDLYLSSGAPAALRVHGKLHNIGTNILPIGYVSKLAQAVMDDGQKKEFAHKPEMNLAISATGIGRFRVNIFKQRTEVGMVIRHIKTHIPTLESLELPPIIQEIIMEKRGLILFVGATGSGKSTSLASAIDYRNQHNDDHIITIEDPIEYLHSHKKSVINQREVGMDTLSYQNALKNTLRQAPDIILIGEIRDQSTMEYAINFAETGHLCLSTLHANNANQAFDRIINFFPEEQKQQLLLDLSLNVRAIISQRLIPSTDGKRKVAVEILLGTPLIRDLIAKGDIAEIKQVMKKSAQSGMQTFDMALYDLYKKEAISYEDALINADSRTDLRLRITMGSDNVSQNTSVNMQLIKENHDAFLPSPKGSGKQN